MITYEYSNICIFAYIQISKSVDIGGGWSEDHIQIFEYLNIYIYTNIQIFVYDLQTTPSRHRGRVVRRSHTNIRIFAYLHIFKYSNICI